MKTITITFTRGESRVTVTGHFKTNIAIAPITWAGDVDDMAGSWGTRLPERDDAQSMPTWIPWAKRHGWDATMTESGDWIIVNVADVV